ncbi:hypothetical protein D3C81_491470 [compost metagenome]|nr:DUF4145 domain-containing protein [Aeromonas hydrophila]
MICPNCRVSIHESFTKSNLGTCGRLNRSEVYYWSLLKQECPACEKPIVYLSHTPVDEQGIHGEPEHFLVFPRHSPRLPAPSEVPPAIATDYNEAGLVLEISAQASAALSRRCLQHLLDDTELSKNSNLNRAIEEAMGKNLPSHITENLDAVRAIGNFAAHTQKSVNTGEILPVEPHEAEWNLDVLDMLFDFCYVQPAKNAARRAALNAKQKEAGKQPIK